MPLSSETFTSNLTEILRAVVEAGQTGYLKMKEGQREGFVAIENGNILHAAAGPANGLPALFQFVSWRDAQMEFNERPIPADLPRDLVVYDSKLLITGIAFKVEEQALLQQALPSLDAVLLYIGSEGLSSLEVTSVDLSLLSLADGHRTVREMAEKASLSPMEVARNLARFRLAGVLELIPPPAPSKRAAMVSGKAA
jgi:hypothetical protein